MKADWDKLADKYASNPSVMIVDVDCTAGGEQTCQKEGVKGYPTVKYYLASDKKGKAYEQGRDYASLEKFTKTTLDVAQCDPLTGKNCKDIEKKFITSNKDKSKAELNALLAKKEAENKARKEEKKAAEKEWANKNTEWKKAEAAFTMASSILKALAKAAKDEL